ncbi:MAG: hypothetical protein J6J30_05335 [Clostridia bacterium]|nr:hypothetical protein [Clostridia bacterium]
MDIKIINNKGLAFCLENAERFFIAKGNFIKFQTNTSGGESKLPLKGESFRPFFSPT